MQRKFYGRISAFELVAGNSPYHSHEKPYFPSPGISWKAQKDQVNIIFPSTFCLKKRHISHHRKVQNKNFSLICKYISINFLAQKNPYFPSPQNSKQDLLVISKYDLPYLLGFFEN